MHKTLMWAAGPLFCLSASAHPAAGAPPPESVAACSSLAVGDACSFSAHGGALRGTCVGPPPDAPASTDRPLACLPERPEGSAGSGGNGGGPPGGHRDPPKEAVEACSGLSEGDACTVTLPDHTLNGTCRKGPKADLPLACAPARR